MRKTPEPNGRPGFVRVDTVHPGDRDGRKGVYVVHMVDEVTQYEHVGAVPGISERFMAPMLEALLLLFPFDVPGFHADNGSEYIDHRAAAHSDLQAARALDRARDEMFRKVHGAVPAAA